MIVWRRWVVCLVILILIVVDSFCEMCDVVNAGCCGMKKRGVATEDDGGCGWL